MTAPRTATHVTSLALRIGVVRHDLRAGEPFRIGRHASNDAALEGGDVSRFHARVEWDEAQPWLVDLGSTNGTLVDGELLTGRAPLRPGTSIRVGGHRLVVEGDDRRPAPALLDAPDEVTLFADADAEREGVFSRNVTLLRLLLDLEVEQRTGTLELALGMSSARLTYCLGRVVAVTFDDLRDLAALERVLAASVGGFRFSARYAPSDGSLDLSIKERLRRGYWDTARALRPPRG